MKEGPGSELPWRAWTTSWGIDHQVAPGEAHERLALVERRHAVLRKAIEVYLNDRKLEQQERRQRIRSHHSHHSSTEWYTLSVAGLLTFAMGVGISARALPPPGHQPEPGSVDWLQ